MKVKDTKAKITESNNPWSIRMVTTFTVLIQHSIYLQYIFTNIIRRNASQNKFNSVL